MLASIIEANQHQPDRDEIKMLKTWKLTEYLDLTESQAERFFPRLNTLEKELHSLQKQRDNLFHELDRMIEDEKEKKRRVDEIIIELDNLGKYKADLLKVHMMNIDDILTTNQKTKYIVFEQKFRKRLKEEILNKGERGKPRLHKRK